MHRGYIDAQLAAGGAVGASPVVLDAAGQHAGAQFGKPISTGLSASVALRVKMTRSRSSELTNSASASRVS